ncbi:MAG: DNA polymerase III subunit delta [Bacilli bacterium]
MNFIIKSNVSNLIDKQVKLLKNKLEETREVEVIKYDMEISSLEEILEEANSYSMWSKFKLIVCTNANFLTAKGIDNSDIKNDYDLLDEYIKIDSMISSVVFIVNGEFDKRKKIYKSLIKKCKLFELDNFDNNKIINLVKNRIDKALKTISDEDAKYVCERLSYNLSLIFVELDKLCLIEEDVITRGVIDILITRSVDDTIFELTSAIIACDIKKAYDIYNYLIMNKEEPIAMIAMTANQFRLLLQVKGYANQGLGEKEIASKLKVHPYRVKLALKNKGFNRNMILRYLDKLCDIDYNIKTGKEDKFEGFRMFILTLKSV